MKKELKLYGAAFLFILVIFVFSFSKEIENRDAIRVSYDPSPVRNYVKTGSSSADGTLRQALTKVYHVTVVPTVANGGTLDISGFGLTTVANVQVSVMRNTATPNDVPTVSLKSISTSSIGYNLIQGNNAIVAILGINVLSGAPNVFVTTPGDCTLRFQITGW